MALESAASRYKRLFIIDDDVEDQEIFIEAVKAVDPAILCFTSTNGEKALEQLEHDAEVRPDMIFLDLNMPKLNGKQVLRGIKSIRLMQDVPVIMYSTSFAPQDIEEIRKLGAVFHLLKPARFDDLCRSLQTILSTSW